LFRFNPNIETLCFGIEAKQPKQTVSKQTEKNEKNEKTDNLFGWVFCLFRFNPNIETFCFGIEAKNPKLVPKLVLVPVSVASNRN
jgi:hypothetical protein